MLFLLSQEGFVLIVTHWLCQEMEELVLPASSGSSVWWELCRALTSPCTSAATARQAASVQAGRSNRLVGRCSRNTTMHANV